VALNHFTVPFGMTRAPFVIAADALPLFPIFPDGPDSGRNADHSARHGTKIPPK